MGRSTVLGMSLGLVLAFGLALVDALWNVSWKQFGALAARAFTALAVGALGGAAGGFLGNLLVDATGMGLFIVLGWTLVGVLIGASIALFEVIADGAHRGAAVRKLLK